MLKLNAQSVKNNAQQWKNINVTLPKFDWETMVKNTKEKPVWIHFGAGNIFRGFIASLQQILLNEGIVTSGIIAADTFDYDIIDKIYTPHDSMTLNVTLNPCGSTSREIIASVAEGIRADSSDTEQILKLKEIFVKPSLQIVSFTITEKGYALANMAGELMSVVVEDMKQGPSKAKHAMSLVTALLFERYKACKAPIALVSMDNCSRNGEKLKNSVLTIVKEWCENGFVDEGFVEFISDESCVSFPWSMIDKITPRPHKVVEESLANDGIEDMKPIITGKNTFIAPFVNAEKSQYLVIEDNFANGRPPLEKAGVYMTDRDTVNNTEKMKVTTCLNPLHTAMSVYGCLLSYNLICEEMKDKEIVALIKRLGYIEGLPVVVDPKILIPKNFIDEVVEKRLPNPFIPDAPQRIATDTSQKVGIRFGETIKSYVATGKSLDVLVSIPLAIAGWLRYLLAVDDEMQAMEVSSDPLKNELQSQLSGIEVGNPNSYAGQLKNILTNEVIFGLNLVEIGLSDKIEQFFIELIAGKGAVRATLKKYLK